jgi:hypothetical protein
MSIAVDYIGVDARAYKLTKGARMANNARKDSLHQVIVSDMQARDTEELLVIWKKNDKNEWSYEAFGIVHDILLERLGSVPEQDAASEAPTEDVDKDVVEETEGYHDTDAVLTVASLASLASKIVLVLGSILIILQALATLELRWQELMGISPLNALYVLAFGIISNGISWGMFYLTLRAVAEVLYLMLDIQQNTAKTSQVGR